MAIIVITKNPEDLLVLIKKAIEQKKIDTWSFDKDGDFFHNTEQWASKAWLRPNVYEEKLVFNTIPPKDKHISSVVYAVYHGRFIEMLLSHFDEFFEKASASALPTVNDRIKSRSLSP